LVYRLAKLVIRDDGSLYCYFPNKNGYFVRFVKAINMRAGTFDIKMKTTKGIHVYNPYLSFHPRKSIIHSNGFDRNGREKIFLRDSETIDQNEIIFNRSYRFLFSFTIPDKLTTLSLYNKTVLPNDDIIFEYNGDDIKSSLNFEFFLHGSFGVMDLNNLKSRINRNIIGVKELPLKCSLLTITNIASTIGASKDKPSREIVCQMYVGKKHDTVFFALRKNPKEDK